METLLHFTAEYGPYVLAGVLGGVIVRLIPSRRPPAPKSSREPVQRQEHFEVRVGTKRYYDGYDPREAKNVREGLLAQHKQAVLYRDGKWKG